MLGKKATTEHATARHVCAVVALCLDAAHVVRVAVAATCTTTADAVAVAMRARPPCRQHLCVVVAYLDTARRCHAASCSARPCSRRGRRLEPLPTSTAGKCHARCHRLHCRSGRHAPMPRSA
uniref:Uncharacterized protein n=1 Tax=Arundo donax TaxID=35708 RepID=A0A0A9B9E6_ARUDO